MSGVAMQFGAEKQRAPGGGLRLIEQGSVQGGGTRSLEKFQPGGMYLLFLTQLNGGVVEYQSGWLFSAPLQENFESYDLLGTSFAASGSYAPTVTAAIASVGISPYNSSRTVQYALYRVR